MVTEALANVTCTLPLVCDALGSGLNRADREEQDVLGGDLVPPDQKVRIPLLCEHWQVTKFKQTTGRYNDDDLWVSLACALSIIP